METYSQILILHSFGKQSNLEENTINSETGDESTFTESCRNHVDTLLQSRTHLLK